MDMNRVIGRDHLCFLTLDTLRFDVAQAEHLAGRTPNFSGLLPAGGWEQRHTPASFTFAAHAAFFAGFLPTPARPGRHPRLFAARFEGSETTTSETWTFEGADWVTGLRAAGYHTVCVGGVGFFNKRGALGSVLPSLFDESHWSPELGVTDPRSFEHQIAVAAQALDRLPKTQRTFLFINVSALHQPNRFYLEGAIDDSMESHAAALRCVDAQLPTLLEALRGRGSWFGIVCSDHGTAYGENGYNGHRLGHPVVWDVPYAEFKL